MKRSGTIASTLLFLIAVAFSAVAATDMNFAMPANAASANGTHTLPLNAAQANLTDAERGQVDEHMRRTLSLLNSMTPKQRAQALAAMATSDSSLDRYVCQLVTESDNALVRHMNEKLSLIKSIPEEHRPQIIASMLNSHNSADRNLAEVIIKHNDQGGDKNAQRLKALSQLGPHDRAELISRLANSTIESDRDLARAALAESAPKAKGDGVTAKPSSSSQSTPSAGNGVAADARSVAPGSNWPVPDARISPDGHNANGNLPTSDYRTAAPAPANNGQFPISSNSQSPMFNAAEAAGPSPKVNGTTNGVRPDSQSKGNGANAVQAPQGLPVDKSPIIAAVHLGGAVNGLANGTVAPLAASTNQPLTAKAAGSNAAPAPAAVTGAAAASGNKVVPAVPSKDVLKSVPMLWNISNGIEVGAPTSPSGGIAANVQQNASGKDANKAGDFLFGSPKNVQGPATNNTMKPDSQVASQLAVSPVNATASQAEAGLRDPITLQTVLVNMTKAQPAGNASDAAQKSSPATSAPSAGPNGTSASNSGGVTSGGVNSTVASGAISPGVNGSASATTNNAVGNASGANSSSPVVTAGLVVVQLTPLKPASANPSSPSTGPSGNNSSLPTSLNGTGSNETPAPVSEQFTVTKSIPRNGTIPGGNLVINVTLGYNMSTVKPETNMSTGTNVSALGRSIPYPVNRTRKHHARSNRKSHKKNSHSANNATINLPLRTYPPSPFKAGLVNISGSAAVTSNVSAEAQPWSKFGNVTRLNGTDSIDPRNDSILIFEDQQLKLVHLPPSKADMALSEAAAKRIYAPESASNKTSNSSSKALTSADGKSTVRIQTSPDQTSWFNTIADYLPSLTAFHRSLYADDDTEPIVERTGEAPVPSEDGILSHGVLGEAPVPSQTKLASGEDRQRLGEAPIPSDSIQSEDLVDDAAALNGEDAADVTSDDEALSDDLAVDDAAANDDEAVDDATVTESQVAEEAIPNDDQISDNATSDDAQTVDGAVSNEASVADEATAAEDHANHEAAVTDDQVVDEAAAGDDQAADEATANEDEVAANDGELAANVQVAAEDEAVDDQADDNVAVESESEGVDVTDGETAVAEGDEQAADDQAVDSATDAVENSENGAEADDQVEDAENLDAEAVEDSIIDGEDAIIESNEDVAVIESSPVA